MNEFKYIYGPVNSWRLGKSLGIDLVSQSKKICDFDCIYCQVGRAPVCALERKLFVPTKSVMEELKNLPKVGIDYLTFSGRGEPTLAINLGEVIREVKKVRSEPVAVLTNSTLLGLPEVRQDLSEADFVVAKLDAGSQETFQKVNNPVPDLELDALIRALSLFRREFSGRLALQVMLVKENRQEAGRIAEIAREIRPDEVQLNTPTRACACAPLEPAELERLRQEFSGLKTVVVYDRKKPKTTPLDQEQTMRRRGE